MLASLYSSLPSRFLVVELGRPTYARLLAVVEESEVKQRGAGGRGGRAKEGGGVRARVK